jgi:hypothetical protein
MKSLLITDENWNKIRTRLVEEYGPKIMLSWVSRRELGFMIRDYQSHDNSRNNLQPVAKKFVDFDDEMSKTMFILKYM